MVKKKVAHYNKWRQDRISKHKKTTWKKYEKYIEEEKGNLSSEIHYYKSHPVKPEKHNTHPENSSDQSHNEEVKKRTDEHKKDLQVGKHSTMYAAATSVRKVVIPSHTNISVREQEQAQYANASKKYHENIKAGGTDASALQVSQEYLNSVGLENHKISPLSNRDSLVINKPNGKHEIAYRGTDKTHLGDLKTDARLIGGIEEGGSQYTRSQEQIANVIAEHGAGSIDHFSGYSKGGGQALLNGAKHNIEATGLNPLIGKNLMNKLDTDKNLKILRTTDDPASLGLVASEHPYELKTINPIKEGYAMGVEPISQSYASHRLENFLDGEAIRTEGAGSQEWKKAVSKHSLGTEMEMLHTAKNVYDRGGTYTDFIHEINQNNPATNRSNMNQHEPHSIVDNEKRLAGTSHHADDIKVRTWDDISEGEFTLPEEKFIDGHMNPYEDNSHRPPMDRNSMRDAELARVKQEIKPYSIKNDPLFTDTRPSMAKTKSQMRDAELARVKQEVAQMDKGAKFGLDETIPGSKPNYRERVAEAKSYQDLEKRMASLSNEVLPPIDPLNVLGGTTKKLLEFPSVPKGSPLERMIDARNPLAQEYKRPKISPVEVPFPEGLEPPPSAPAETQTDITNRSKKLKDNINRARGQHNEEILQHRETFGTDHDIHLHHDERSSFIDLPANERVSKINQMREQSAQHANNSSEHFGTGETTVAPSGLKQLAGAFHPTSIAMGLGAGLAAESAMNLVDKDHKIPKVPRGFLTGGVAGGMGNIAARGLGIAGEKLVERGAISAGMAETVGLAAGGVGLLPEIIAGGAGYVAGELGGMGVKALVKEAGGDEKAQGWGESVGGGAIGGATSGAIIGSVVPGIGTAVGAGIGFVGGAAMGALANTGVFKSIGNLFS